MLFQLCLFLLVAGQAFGKTLCTPEYKRDGPAGPGCAEPPAPPGPVCRRLADVALVLDASASIGNASFELEMQFAQKIIGAFEVAPDRTRFAAVTFSDRYHVEFNFNTHSTATEVSSAISSIPYASGPATLMYKGLQLTHDSVFTRANGARDDVPDLVILITDGETNPGRADTRTKPEALEETQRQANRLKQMGVALFTIGVGSRVNHGELTNAASAPEYYLRVRNYQELNTDEIVNKISKLTCEKTKPPAPKCPKKPQPPEVLLGRRQNDGPPGSSGPSGTSTKIKCVGKPADLFFILDQSTSLMLETNFQKELDFVNGIVDDMDFAKTKISVMKFSDDANIEIRFNQYNTKEELKRAVSDISWDRGNTYTDRALNLMLHQGFTAANGARNKVDKIGVIITDGGSTDPDPTRVMAAEVQKAGITMYAIGVGPEFAANERDNLAELNAIASDPDSEFVFTVNDVNALDAVMKKITSSICENICEDEPEKECENLAADIVFLLDKSTSLDTAANFNKELSFVSDLVASFDVSPSTTRVSVITFSTLAQVEFDLDTYGSRSQVQNALTNVNYTGGNTNMHLAFDLMLTREFSGPMGDRVVDKKIAIILTDGNPTDPWKLEKEVAKAKGKGIQIFAVGIGPDINPDKLDEIATSEQYSFKVLSLDTLSMIRKRMGLLVCERNTAT